ncbi:hypothetical protein D5F52_26615 (plasmid) [Brevibacillus laterosporus]|uniref:hypothetical protein n=1 Tax=Brevibacillus laterosporus TaxID=1465 RepID=UPI000E6C2114|nr:hypothetical protein [Brevibacillus laterosporus]AYB41729.1 hypothetical protein D5F52_26615 [Brevibacillus laterosporus]MBG9790961.1 hypothetical protein [Brevibacillus laterosporus]MBG9804916.1 hypothetical protein [Brevibacillus laterosporus]MED1790564.1 hypothetical protein [Brevibacillus laterosporus]MED4762075.1 hypothetical protein [Brevibacillus laterosporus]
MFKKAFTFMLVGCFLIMIFGCVQASAKAEDERESLKIEAMNNKEIKNGLQKMEVDLSEKGESLSIPLTVAGIFIGVLMFLVGAIFSKKVLLSGLIVIAGTFGCLVILGDIPTFIDFLNDMAKMVRSWFK